MKTLIAASILIVSQSGSRKPDVAWLTALGKAEPAAAAVILAKKPEPQQQEILVKALQSLETLETEKEAKSVFRGLIRLSDHTGSAVQRTQARLPMIYVLSDAKELDASLDIATETLAISLQTNDEYWIGESQLRKGYVLQEREEYAKAVECFHEAVRLLPRKGPKASRVGSAYNNLGYSLNWQEKYEESLRYIDIGLAYEHLTPSIRASCIKHKAHALYGLNRIDEALRCFEEAGASAALSPDLRAMCYSGIAKIATERNDTQLEIRAGTLMAQFFELAEDWKQAVGTWITVSSKTVDDRFLDAWRMLESAKRCLKKINDPGSEASFRINESVFLSQIGRKQEALVSIDTAYKYFASKGMHREMAMCLANAGETLDNMGQTVAEVKRYRKVAIEKFRQAAALNRKAGEANGAINAELGLLRFSIDDGKLEEGVSQLRAIRATIVMPSDSQYVADALTLKAHSLSLEAAALINLKRLDEALSALDEAEGIHRQLKSFKGATTCRQVRAALYEAKGDLNEAARHWELTLQTVEDWRKELGKPGFQIGAQGSLGALAGQGADVYVRLGHVEDGFRFVQRAKAGSLLPKSETDAFSSQRLRPDELLIEYSLGNETLVAFVVRGDGKPTRAIRQPWGREHLARDVESFNKALQGGDGRTIKFANKRLYDQLIKPIESDLRSAKSVIFCPDDRLHELPFSALANPQGSALIERFQVATAPSATVWAISQSRQRSGDSTFGRVMAFAVSRFSERLGPVANRGSLSPLPNAPLEAQVVARTFKGRTQAFNDKLATRSAFLKNVPQAAILHVATHAIGVRDYPMQTLLVLTKGPKEDSGVIYPRDVLEMNVKCRLVVLSSCQSIRGPRIPGEGMQNFAWAFLAAGSSNVISTNWEIDDGAALAWSKAFYARFLKLKDIGESFRQACLSLKKSKEYADPVHWAAWTLSGAG